MRGEIVAVDLETTGLDPNRDRIIEVGAVRFREGEIIDTFSTLIDPGVSIPARITWLTGITDEDVTGAPRMSAIVNELHEFIGNAPVLGHKTSFDLSFLRRFDIGTMNTPIDTYELASVLMPTAARYSLASLVEQLDLADLDNAHRALDDTIATCNLYWALWQMLMELPLIVLKEIVAAAVDLDWDAKLPLIEALQIRSRDALNEPVSSRPLMPFTAAKEQEWPTLRPNDNMQALDSDSLASEIGPSGRMAKHITNYESRIPQIEMLRKVTESFNHSQHTMIEAPTGTGKSIAYLIPAIHWATLNQRRVMIATATIALQDQLMKKDIPLLQEALRLKFEAAVAKGRANYLCPRKLESLRRRRPSSVDELRVLSKILVWLQTSDSGDRAEISLRGVGEEVAWTRLSAHDEGCTLDRCGKQMSGACPFYKSRRRAEGAHIIVANHALLLSDVQLGNRVLPEHEYVVIDEAHHLEEAATSGLTSRIDRGSLRRRFLDLGNTEKGLLGDIIRAVRESDAPQNFVEQIQSYTEIIAQAVKDMMAHVDEYFKVILTFLQGLREWQPSEYSLQIRIVSAMRDSGDWEVIPPKWKNLKEFMAVIAKSLNKVSNALDQLQRYDIAHLHDHMSSLESTADFLTELSDQLETFTNNPLPNIIYWCEVKNNFLSLNAAPLHVGPLISEHLWMPKESIILTSATMTTANSFAYVRERLDADRENVEEFTVETPFDYKSSTLVYIPTDFPEPTSRQMYQNMVERGIIELATALGGRLLGLFTSYAQLRQTAQAITPRLALGGIMVLDQGSGSSRQLLIDSFKSTEKAVLLGTRSFWEGVDLPGDDLQALVIARLPFTVPSDPIFAARSETFQNSFMQYAVPDAILRFRQGFGRLIRRRTDRGVVTIFDRRIVSKRYGRAFLDSLPNCTIQHGSLDGLSRAAKEWVDQ